MEQKPLDLEHHEDETWWDVWKRRIMFIVLIGLCIAFAAPVMGSCSGALGGGGQEVVGAFTVDGEVHEVRENEYVRTLQRLAFTNRMFLDQQDTSEAEVWRHLMLDAAARAEGVHVPATQVANFLSSVPQFQRAGEFDPELYAEVVKEYSQGLRPELVTQTIIEKLRVAQYEAPFYMALADVPSEQVYESWRKNNLKLTVDYVVQPFSALEAEIAALAPTDEELRTVENLPEVRELRTIPSGKVVEAAYVRVADLTAEEFEAMRAYALEAELFEDADAMKRAAWEWFWSNRAPGAFTRENWVAAQMPAYAEARSRHAAELEAWEALPEADRGARPEAPRDPGQVEWPSEPRFEFERHWVDPVSREVVAREVLRHMALRAEREGKSFEDLLEIYGPLGVKVVRNPTPLPDARFAEDFPAGLGEDTELGQVVRGTLTGPREGAVFTPKVAPEPIPTTAVAQRIGDRGFMVLRLHDFRPGGERPLPEVRERVVEFWRSHQVRERASARLEDLRREIEEAAEGGDERAALLSEKAQALGLDVRTLQRFNRNTPMPRPPEGPRTPEEQAARDRILHRNRVQEDYLALVATGEGEFRKPVLLDDRTDAAYLELLREKYEPGPLEMDQSELEFQRTILSRQGLERTAELVSFETLAQRFDLQTKNEVRTAAE